MAIEWPPALVTELAERRCIVFMGAGTSMGSLAEDGVRHPPDWERFLKDAAQLVQNPGDKKHALALINKSQLLDAAEVIADRSNQADFTDYLRNTFVQPHFSPSELHKLILEIDPKIVITTNYDDIYDHYCKSGHAESGYNICKYYERFAVENIRSRIRLVVKAHGCVSDPTQIVLSRSSYYRAKRDNPGFYQLLDALFLTHTLLFVGASLTDPDIQLVLENANLSAPSAHPHYALVEKTRHESIKAAIKSTHNVELIEYPRKKHEIALQAMSDLKDKVISQRTLSA
ncbi:MAG: SIR2 family protein [Acidobacteriia bacterium]|nr:SIR2 family protein [Terriglobia bacterium]